MRGVPISQLYEMISLLKFCRNLKHPHIISLLAYSMTSEQIVLVTNYVDGNNSDTIIFNKKYAKEVRQEFHRHFNVHSYYGYDDSVCIVAVYSSHGCRNSTKSC